LTTQQTQRKPALYGKKTSEILRLRVPKGTVALLRELRLDMGDDHAANALIKAAVLTALAEHFAVQSGSESKASP
jgi:hypothetical protein